MTAIKCPACLGRNIDFLTGYESYTPGEGVVKIPGPSRLGCRDCLLIFDWREALQHEEQP